MHDLLKKRFKDEISKEEFLVQYAQNMREYMDLVSIQTLDD